MRSLNQEGLKTVKENKNIFNMKHFEQFSKSEYYVKIQRMFEDDSVNIEKYFGIN